MSVEHNATGSIPLLLHNKSKPVDDVEYEEEDGEGDQELERNYVPVRR